MPYISAGLLYVKFVGQELWFKLFIKSAMRAMDVVVQQAIADSAENNTVWG